VSSACRSEDRSLKARPAPGYGAALLITVLSFVGLILVERGHEIVVGGWVFSTAGLFAIGRLAHLTQRDDDG
jgi:hypothetical protein